MLKLFCRILGDHYEISTASDGRAGVETFKESKFDLVVTDIRMPGMSGMQLLDECKRIRPEAMVILMTAYGSEELAVQAMKQGADDYIAKGRMQIDELEMRISRALKQQDLEEENVSLRQRLDVRFGLDNIVGDDEPFGLAKGSEAAGATYKVGDDSFRLLVMKYDSQDELDDAFEKTAAVFSERLQLAERSDTRFAAKEETGEYVVVTNNGTVLTVVIGAESADAAGSLFSSTG